MKKTNTEPYISTYLHTKGRKLGLPIAGNFELTARCNFSCPMCYVHLGEAQVKASGKELTAQQWLSIARDARDAGMIFVLLTGGEPFMRRDFFEIYRGMKELGLMISINTNGSMITGEILEQLLLDPPFRMNISLYGGCNETYERMCGRPVYDKVKENIRALKQAGVDVSLNLSITPFNREDLPKIYGDATALDVNVRTSAYMYPPVRINGEQYGCGNRMPPEEAAESAIAWDKLRFTAEELDERAANLKLALEEGCPTEFDEGVSCRAGSSSFWLTWDGKMMPCGMMNTPVVYPLEQGFTAAWEQLRQQTAAIRLPSECSGCEFRQACNVCAAVCLTESGRFDGVPGYLCRMTRERVRLMKEGAGNGH